MVPLYDSSGCYLIDRADRLLIDSVDWLVDQLKEIDYKLIIDRDNFAWKYSAFDESLWATDAVLELAMTANNGPTNIPHCNTEHSTMHLVHANEYSSIFQS